MLSSRNMKNRTNLRLCNFFVYVLITYLNVNFTAYCGGAICIDVVLSFACLSFFKNEFFVLVAIGYACCCSPTGHPRF